LKYQKKENRRKHSFRTFIFRIKNPSSEFIEFYKSYQIHLANFINEKLEKHAEILRRVEEFRKKYIQPKLKEKRPKLYRKVYNFLYNSIPTNIKYREIRWDEASSRVRDWLRGQAEEILRSYRGRKAKDFKTSFPRIEDCGIKIPRRHDFIFLGNRLQFNCLAGRNGKMVLNLCRNKFWDESANGGTPKTLIIKHKDGRFYIYLQVDYGEIKSNGNRPIFFGIDLNCKDNLAVLGTQYPKKFIKTFKCTEYRQGYWKANKAIAEISAKQMEGLPPRGKGEKHPLQGQLKFWDTKRHNLTIYCLHSVTSEIIKIIRTLAHDLKPVVGIEKLQRGKGKLKAGKVHNARWSRLPWYIFKQFLEYKVEEIGGELIEIEPKGTSQTCHRCKGVRIERGGKWREFVCKNCGLMYNRDANAALNIAASAKSEYLKDGLTSGLKVG